MGYELWVKLYALSLKLYALNRFFIHRNIPVEALV